MPSREQWPLWYYQDLVGVLQGPFDAPSMLKWYQSGALPDGLLVHAAPPPAADGSAAATPSGAGGFRPLGELLAMARAGAGAGDGAEGASVGPGAGVAEVQQQQQQQQQRSQQQQRNYHQQPQRSLQRQAAPRRAGVDVLPAPDQAAECAATTAGPAYEPAADERRAALERLLLGGGAELWWRALLPGGDRVGPFRAQQMAAWLLRGQPPKGIVGTSRNGGGRGGAGVAHPPDCDAVLLCGMLAADYNPQSEGQASHAPRPPRLRLRARPRARARV
jgi:hypothetical protein